MAIFDVAATLRQGTSVVAVDFHVEARAIALVGPSGAGKTSLLEAIAGIRTPQSGRIALDGHVLFDSAAGSNLPPQRRRVGYVPQDILLFPHLTVRGNVTYAPPRGPAADPAAVARLLEIDAMMDRAVTTLSGGERQRVALARALHSGPALLLLDEPLAAVDRGRRGRILDALQRVRDDLRVPLIYVTHAPEEAAVVADYAVVLEAGRVVAQGEPRSVLT